jgi:alpha-glucosidase
MNKLWWQNTTIYQIYPRSFQDSNNDGVGDLKGVLDRLDYLQQLGVETLWMSPFYASPGQDHGYDISDYYSIDPLLGDMATAMLLIEEVHKRGMKIIMDMVMNHTSVEHHWFRESRSSRDNPKRDWYIWRKGKRPGGKNPPNNWRSMIGKKGWNYNSATDEWYYSSFLSFQPDLNWKNPEVKKIMFDVVRFWLDEGVDGFRLDIFNCLGKNQSFPDNPFYPRYFPKPDDNDHCFWQNKLYNFNHSDSFGLAKELRQVIDEYPGRFLIGEVSGNDGILKRFLGEKHDGLNLVFQFELLHYKFSRKFFKEFFSKMEREFSDPYLPTLVFSNHDSGRGISRVKNNLVKAKLLALLQLTGRGVPILYYGDEIGMGIHDLPIKGAIDPLAKDYSWAPKWLARWTGILLNRDDARTPMQWTPHEGRGFSGKPEKSWLPPIPRTEGRDVLSQKDDPDSLWQCYSQLLKLRKELLPLNRGDCKIIPCKGDVLMYQRDYDGEVILIAVNFGCREECAVLGDIKGRIAYKGASVSQIIRRGDGRSFIKLAPFSGVVILNSI